MFGLHAPRVALVLESGAARGLAHIGVLKVLEAAGVKPDIITGTSMGALVGAFYAAGLTAAEIEEIAVGFDVRSLRALADISIRNRGMLNGDRVESFIAEHVPATFEEMRVPFGCVATDLAQGQPVWFTSGDVVKAVRASISVPLVFSPVRLDDALYVDGCITEPLPVACARSLGAEVVIAVSVAGSGTVVLDGAQGREPSLLRLLNSALHADQPHVRGSSSLDIMTAVVEITERELSRASEAEADVVIRPDVTGITGFEFLAAPSAIAAGEAAAVAAMDDVVRVLSKRRKAAWGKRPTRR